MAEIELAFADPYDPDNPVGNARLLEADEAAGRAEGWEDRLRLLAKTTFDRRERDALQAARVIGHLLAGLALDRKQVLFGVRVGNGAVLAGADSHDFAASRIAQHITGR